MAAQPLPDAPFAVAGKTAIVTGAGSGINLEFARLLASRGCNVVLADLSLRPEAAEFVEQHKGEDGNQPDSNNISKGRAIFVPTDVTSWPALDRLFRAALAEFGDFDLLCPGAGVYEPPFSNFWLPPGSAPESRDDPGGGRYASIDINVTHPIRATQLALSIWLAGGASSKEEEQSESSESSSGSDRRTTKRRRKRQPASLHNPKRVVHISSVAGQLPVFRAPIYGATKHAISGFVRCLAPLRESGINVTAVAPGVVRTPLWTEHPEKLKNVDTSRDAWVTAEECAAAMLRCAESEPAGTVLEVGCGSTRRVAAMADPGPDFRPEAGIVASNSDLGDREVWAWLRDPRYWAGPSKL